MGQNQNDEMKSLTMWCICKEAAVYDYDMNQTDSICFGKQTWRLGIKDGMVQILYTNNQGKGKLQGWVNAKALSSIKPVNYAMLRYQNSTGKRIPVARRYKGKAEGWILPGEEVAVRAVVGEWCITNKGWTLFKWLKKCRGDFFDDNAQDVLMAVLLQAVKDYQMAVNRLKMGKCCCVEDYCKTFGTIDEITRWFNGHQYGLYYNDDGKEKLQWLNENLGVDKKWFKDKRRVYEEIKMNGRRRR
jgi:hypothetical protein